MITAAGRAGTVHRRIEETERVREAAGLTLRVESGRDERGIAAGIPYGSVARMILLYLQTEAVRAQSHEVEFGRYYAQAEKLAQAA